METTTHEHILPGGQKWRSATRRPYGNAPIKINDRVLVRPGDPNDEDAHLGAPRLAIVVDLDTDNDRPIFREFHIAPRHEQTYDELQYVDTIEELVPGSWTRIPW
jgi:hypothetical protein